MKARHLSVLAVSVLTLAALPALGQQYYQFNLVTSGQSACSMTKYVNKIACLPTIAATTGIHDERGYFDSEGNFVTVQLGSLAVVPSVFGLGAQYASQLATSPSAATSAGYVFTFTNGALSATPADLGPLLSDLPQTIGRSRLYVGASYQWMEFSKTGGKDMKSFMYSTGYVDSYSHGYNYISANMNLKMHSFNTYLSYGITDRLEASVVIPWSRTSMSIQTVCPTSQYGTDPNSWTFDGIPECAMTGAGQAMPVTNQNGDQLYIDGQAAYDVDFTVPNSQKQTASGLGDVTFRGKYEVLKTGRQGLAVGAEYRLPTGDPLNLLGSGAAGIRPFLSWGYNNRVSPHANVGFQYNGSSVDDVHISANANQTVSTVGDTTTITETVTYSNTVPSRKLPNIFTVSGGADFAVNRRLNLDADLLMRVFSNDGSKTWSGMVGDIPLNENGVTNAPFFNGARTKTTAVVGAKGKLSRHFLLSVNVMIDAENNGLSYKPSPIGTLSYDFGGGEK